MFKISDFTGRRIMIIVAHPDDEILGLGGAMNRITQSADVTTHVVILGEGITSRSISRDTQKWEEELRIHKNNIREAQQKIGYHDISIYDFPDNRFDSVALLDIVKVVETEKSKFKPDIIFTHHGGDLNIDHQRTFEAVMTASRPLEHETVKTIICFETLSGTEWRAASDPKHFIPNFFIAFEEVSLQSKIDAMESYSFEKRSYPHPRSPEAIKIRAQMWGVAVGVPYAEPFTIIRHMVK